MKSKYILLACLLAVTASGLYPACPSCPAYSSNNKTLSIATDVITIIANILWKAAPYVLGSGCILRHQDRDRIENWGIPGLLWVKDNIVGSSGTVRKIYNVGPGQSIDEAERMIANYNKKHPRDEWKISSELVEDEGYALFDTFFLKFDWKHVINWGIGAFVVGSIANDARNAWGYSRDYLDSMSTCPVCHTYEPIVG